MGDPQAGRKSPVPPDRIAVRDHIHFLSLDTPFDHSSTSRFSVPLVKRNRLKQNRRFEP